MTLKDESLLTAYLDGELAPEARQTVESALLEDAELAKQLRQLAEVRDLVAGLPRPLLTIDLAPEIGRRVSGRRLPRGVWPALRERPRVLAGGLAALAVAATLLVALGLSLHARWPAAPAVRPAGLPRLEVVAAPPPDTGPARSAAKVRTTALAPPPTTGNPGKAVRGPRPRDRTAADTVRALLDNPRLRRVFIVTDVIGGGTSSQVEELVQKIPRTSADYGRITISQGIVIDPLHPREATVFALVMNEQELRHFQRKLEQAFPQRVEDSEADPVVVAQLAEVGQMAVLPGTPASEVVIPRDALPPITALRSDTSRQQPVETSKVKPDFGLPDLGDSVGVGVGVVDNAPQPRSQAQPTAPGVAPDVPGARPSVLTGSRGAGDAQATGAGAPPATAPLARTEERPSDPGEALGSLPASLRDIDLHEPPEIVLVWVTPP